MIKHNSKHALYKKNKETGWLIAEARMIFRGVYIDTGFGLHFKNVVDFFCCCSQMCMIST